tara:strand:+ start:1850 stop:2062 length:213 start_codon:yes stop_codon:yes gene_type:complete
MDNLCLHHVEEVFVSQKDFSDFRTFNFVFKQKDGKRFQVETFTTLKTELDLTVLPDSTFQIKKSEIREKK